MSESVKELQREFAKRGIQLFLFGSRSKVWYPLDYKYNKDHWLVFGDSKCRITAETDWDFAVPWDTPDKVLIDMGFEKKPDKDYYDPITHHVFEKTLEDGSRVQISGKHDFDDFKLFWRSIPSDFYEDRLWKSGPNKPKVKEITYLISNLWWFYQSVKSKLVITADQLWE